MDSLLAEKQTGARQAAGTAPGSAPPVLRVEELEVTYYTDLGRARALDGASFTLSAGEKLGMVGESGSGKSTMALAMMRMIKPPGKIEGGRVYVGETELMGADIPSAEPMRSAYLTLLVNSIEEAERIYGTLSEGGEIFMPMTETFFAFRFGQLRDKFGANWMIIHERPRPS